MQFSEFLLHEQRSILQPAFPTRYHRLLAKSTERKEIREHTKRKDRDEKQALINKTRLLISQPPSKNNFHLRLSNTSRSSRKGSFNKQKQMNQSLNLTLKGNERRGEIIPWVGGEHHGWQEHSRPPVRILAVRMHQVKNRQKSSEKRERTRTASRDIRMRPPQQEQRLISELLEPW